MGQPELRVRYDSPATVHEMLDWLVDSDPIELRDVAQNLLADVETLKAALSAAERRGREAAIADLRDKASELRRLAVDAKERRDHGESVYEQHYQRFLAQAAILDQLIRRWEAQTKPVEGRDG